MNKYVVLLSVFVCAIAQANVEENQAMFDMMLSMMKNSPADGRVEAAACLGVSEAKLESMAEHAMKTCFEQHKTKTPEDFMDSMDACFEPTMEKQSGLSKAQFDRCESKEDKALEKLAHIEDQIDALYDQLDELLYDTEGNHNQIEMLENQLDALNKERRAVEDSLDRGMGESAFTPDSMEASMEQMEEVMQWVSEASEQSLHLITLPVYENSQVMMHMADSSQMEMAGVTNALPSATFASKDPAEKILAFYRKKLPDFKYKHLGNGEHILMETMPDDFNILKDMDLYLSTPHVLIRPMDGKAALGAPADAQSSIEVSYRQKN